MEKKLYFLLDFINKHDYNTSQFTTTALMKKPKFLLTCSKTDSHLKNTNKQQLNKLKQKWGKKQSIAYSFILSIPN